MNKKEKRIIAGIETTGRLIAGPDLGLGDGNDELDIPVNAPFPLNSEVAVKIPAMILVRAGSQRLKKKWALPWRTEEGRFTTLLEHSVRQVLRAKHVGLVYVASDGRDIIDTVSATFGHDTREPYAREPDGFTRVEAIYRGGRGRKNGVNAAQRSLDGLTRCLRKARLETSTVLLVQATYPFLKPEDIDRLIETWWRQRYEFYGMFLSRPGEPTEPAGAAWIVDPVRGYSAWSPVAVSNPPEEVIDIDVRKHYRRACAVYEEKHARAI